MEKLDLAGVRMRQLRNLENTRLDKPIEWEEPKAVKVPFFDSYTFKTVPVKVKAGVGWEERLRGVGVFAMVRELEELGCLDEALEVVQQTKAAEPLSKATINFKIIQLQRLVDPTRDRKISWREPGRDLSIQADRALTEKIRRFGLFSLYSELCALGYEEITRGILESGQSALVNVAFVKCPFKSSLACPYNCQQYTNSINMTMGDGSGRLADLECMNNRDSWARNILRNKMRLDRCEQFNPGTNNS